MNYTLKDASKIRVDGNYVHFIETNEPLTTE